MKSTYLINNLDIDETPPVTRPKGPSAVGPSSASVLLTVFRREAGVGNPWLSVTRLIEETGLTRKEVEAGLARLVGSGVMIRAIREEERRLLVLWRLDDAKSLGSP